MKNCARFCGRLDRNSINIWGGGRKFFKTEVAEKISADILCSVHFLLYFHFLRS
jgi:hypothetical protein